MTPWEPTSRCSPESEGSTSPSKPSDSDAPDRSSGTDTASGSSSDGGLAYPDGMTLLPTPVVTDAKATRNRTANRSHPASKHHDGVTLTDALTSSAEGSPANPPPPLAGAREPRTTAGSGPSSPVSLASWDPATSSWRTFQASLLSTEDERFPRSWETWPRSGMTRRGVAFALPTWERRIEGNGSSYLPTATARDWKDGTSAHTVPENGLLGRAVPNLLHTPTTGDTVPNYDHRASPGYVRNKPVPNLAAQVDKLLPTPRAEKLTEAQRDDFTPNLMQRIADLSLGDLTSPPSEDGNEP